MMEWVKEIGGGLSAVVIVIQFTVIGVLFRQLLKSQQEKFDAVVELGKESREREALGNQTLHEVKTAVNLNTEVMRQFMQERRDRK